MNRKFLIVGLVIVVAILLSLIPIISMAGNADIHSNNLFIASKIMNGECGNGICEIDEIILTQETECYVSDEPPQGAVCGLITKQKILCEKDCKKPEPTTKPEEG